MATKKSAAKRSSPKPKAAPKPTQRGGGTVNVPPPGQPGGLPA